MAETTKLSARKRASLWVLILMIKIIEPTSYSSEYSKELDHIKASIKDI